MSKFVVIEEMRVVVKMPATTTDRRVHAAVRTLAQKDVTVRIRGAVRKVIVQFPVLAGSRLSVSQ